MQPRGGRPSATEPREGTHGRYLGRPHDPLATSRSRASFGPCPHVRSKRTPSTLPLHQPNNRSDPPPGSGGKLWSGVPPEATQEPRPQDGVGGSCPGATPGNPSPARSSSEEAPRRG